jgi:hypothetical protein
MIGSLTGWRTVVVNLLASGLAMLNAKFEVIQMSGDEQTAAVVTLMAVVNIAMRVITKTKIGSAT